MKRVLAGVGILSTLLGAPVQAVEDAGRRDRIQRRQAVMEAMGGRGMLILFSGQPKRYSNDVWYEFRQESNFYYLTGIREPETMLVLMPRNLRNREILFIPDRNPRKELWDGKMLGREEASRISGISTVWSSNRFESFVESILQGRSFPDQSGDEYARFFQDPGSGGVDVFLLLRQHPGSNGKLTRELEFASGLGQRFTGIQTRDIAPALHRLRMVKSAYELEQLRRAIDITIDAHLEVMRRVEAGMWEYEVEAVIEHSFKRRNSSDWAFPSIVASGPNATVLHYNRGQRRIRKGELLLLDIGAEWNLYAADVARTLPVGGRYSEEQAEIYDLVLEAQQAALQAVTPGSTLARVQRRAIGSIKQGLHRLGLITDVSGDQYRAFLPHGTSHFLGLDVHDVRSGDRLEPGMVFTIEPGVYVRPDSLKRLAQQGVSDSDLKTIGRHMERYLNIGVRIEDDIVVTGNGYDLLSARLPRGRAEIESSMKAR